jgi:hypothetical protein
MVSSSAAPTVGRKEAVTVTPEEWPDLLSVGLRQSQFVKGAPGMKLESAFIVSRGQQTKSWMHLEEEHEPVGLAIVARLTNDARQVEVRWFDGQTDLFRRFTTRASIG